MTKATFPLRIPVMPAPHGNSIGAHCFSTPFSLAKVWRGRPSPMNKLKYRHKNLRQPSADYSIIWVFLIFYLIFLGLWPYMSSP